MTLIKNIQGFIDFVNFYQHFIQSFSKIAILLILLLKATKSLNLVPNVFRTNDNEVVGINGRTNITFKNLSKSKKSKNDKSENLTCMLNIEAIRKLTFLISNTKNVFNYLRLTFIKA